MGTVYKELQKELHKNRYATFPPLANREGVNNSNRDLLLLKHLYSRGGTMFTPDWLKVSKPFWGAGEGDARRD
jgi:hypothetical protein